jgi:hypothetical protein
LIVAVNFRRVLAALRAYRLRSRPSRSPRESAALWYERMIRRIARLGWRKLPSQTPTDFVAAIQEPALQARVARFTHAYESARFGRSIDAAESLPQLFEEINAENRQKKNRASTGRTKNGRTEKDQIKKDQITKDEPAEITR